MTRGEVWWGEHPEAGSRPYLILSREAAIPVLQRLVVVPATRTVRGIPSEVTLSRRDGMPSPCALAFDDITTVPKGLLTTRICRLGAARMTEVCQALAIAAGC